MVRLLNGLRQVCIVRDRPTRRIRVLVLQVVIVLRTGIHARFKRVGDERLEIRHVGLAVRRGLVLGPVGEAKLRKLRAVARVVRLGLLERAAVIGYAVRSGCYGRCAAARRG